MKKILSIALLIFVLCVNSFAVQTYNFGIFTDNGSYNDSKDASFAFDISKANGKMVTIDIFNKSSVSSSVQEIYIDDDGSMIQNVNKVYNKYSSKTQEGVKFKKFKGNGFNAENFDVSKKLSLKASTSKKPQQTGIDMGEHLQIRFKLKKGTTYDDFIAAIEAKQLKIGLKINSFPDNSSESALSLWTASLTNNPPTDSQNPAPTGPTDKPETKQSACRPPVVPAPAAAVLVMLGFGCVTALRRKIT